MTGNKEVFINLIHDDIGSFWVVLNPNKDSELEDIIFEADFGTLIQCIRGDLGQQEFIAFYFDELSAITIAQNLIKNIENNKDKVI